MPRPPGAAVESSAGPILGFDAAMERAHEAIGGELERFVRNTMEYLTAERDLILRGERVPSLRTPIAGRPAVVVIRGSQYREDLRTLRAYIREMKPVLIAVDDLQWADAATVAVLEGWVHAAGDVPLLVIGAFVEEDRGVGVRVLASPGVAHEGTQHEYVEPVEPHFVVVALRNVPGPATLALPLRRQRVEVAGAAVIAVACFYVIDFHVPILNLSCRGHGNHKTKPCNKISACYFFLGTRFQGVISDASRNCLTMLSRLEIAEDMPSPHPTRVDATYPYQQKKKKP